MIKFLEGSPTGSIRPVYSTDRRVQRVLELAPTRSDQGAAVETEQRTPKDAAAFERAEGLWVPYTVHGAQGRRRNNVEPNLSDRYAAVDDIADGMIVFEISSWPYLDMEGRLYFEDDPNEWIVEREASQNRIDKERKEDRITGPSRPIRVGDAFLLRGVAEGASSLERVEKVMDISAAARNAAKAALFGAAASTVEKEYAATMAVTATPVTTAPQPGEFDVGQAKSSQPPRPGMAQ